MAHITLEQATDTSAPSLATRIVRLLASLVFVGGASLFAVQLWLSRTWAELTFDEIIFHLRASIAGTDTTVIWDFCLHYLPILVLVCALVLWGLSRARRRGTRALRVGIAATLALGLAFGGVALHQFYQMLGINPLAPSDGPDFVGEHYANPADVEVTFPERKRNLIYIFLESMELTFTDEQSGGAWEEDLIPELTELAREGETFTGDDTQLNGAIVLPGCTWTMGGMFCQSSGVPLKLPVHNNRSALVLDDFFPELTCLGDMLQEEGYQQHLLIGSDASFGNRREYYTEHGAFDIFDYNHAIEEGFIPEDYKVFWGFEDEKLFAQARTMLGELSRSDEPFNLTMLTVDTHFEDGYVCRLCQNEHGDDQYANVMSCSSRQVSEFVRWIQDQDFYEDTTIIINGDHTTMDKDFCDDVDPNYQRKTYTAIINGQASVAEPDAHRTYATVDLFPTTLAALGCQIEGDRLGLGTNLYSSEATLIEELGLDACTDGFNRRSEFLDGYSEVPSGRELVDTVLKKADIKLVYKVDEAGENTGFILRNIHSFNEGVIVEAKLELTDTRTNTTETYPMEVWRKNENWQSKYYLITRLEIPEDELQYYVAGAFVTVEGDRSRLYASWDGSR